MTKFSAAVAALALLILTYGASGTVLHGNGRDRTAAATGASATPAGVVTTPNRDGTVPKAAVGEAPVLIPVSLTPAVRISEADDVDRTALATAIERFRSNGLELPDLEVQFFDDEADCGGHHGLFQRRFTPWRVLVCSKLAFVVTHELAHAWEAATLDDAARASYTTARGLPTWDDPRYGWNERGVEDAAFIVQQNLMNRCANLDALEWRERAAAFELLTGVPSPLTKCA